MISKNEDSEAFNARSTRLWTMEASAYGSETGSRWISIDMVSLVAYVADDELRSFSYEQFHLLHRA